MTEALRQITEPEFQRDSRPGISAAIQEKTERQPLLRESLNLHADNQSIKRLLPLIDAIDKLPEPTTPQQKQVILINMIYYQGKGIGSEESYELPTLEGIASLFGLESANATRSYIDVLDNNEDLNHLYSEVQNYRKRQLTIEEKIIILRSLRIDGKHISKKRMARISQTSERRVRATIKNLINESKIKHRYTIHDPQKTQRIKEQANKPRQVLAQEVGVSKRTIYRRLAQLREAGEIEANKLRKQAITIFDASRDGIAHNLPDVPKVVRDTKKKAGEIFQQFLEEHPGQKVNLTRLSEALGVTTTRIGQIYDELEASGFPLPARVKKPKKK